MTVVIVARKPTSDSSSALQLGLLVAGAQNMSTLDLQNIAGVEVASNTHSHKKRSSHKKNDYSSKEKILIDHTLKWVKSCSDIPYRRTLKQVSASSVGNIRYLSSLMSFVENMGTQESAETTNIPVKAGEKMQTIVHSAAAQTYVSTYGNPEILKSLPKPTMLGTSGWTQEIENFVARCQKAQPEMTAAGSKAFADSHAHVQLRDSILKHMVEFNSNKIRTDKQKHRSRSGNNSTKSARFIADMLNSTKSTSSSRTNEKTEMSTERWSKYVSAVKKAINTKTVKKSKVMDFITTQAGLRATNEDQLNLLAASTAIARSYHEAFNPSAAIVRDGIAKEKLWNTMAEFAFPQAVKQAKSLMKSQIPETMQEFYQASMPSSEVADSNIVGQVVFRLNKIAELNATDNASEGLTFEKLISMNSEDLKRTLTTGDKAMTGTQTVADWIKSNGIKIMNLNKLKRNQVDYEVMKPTEASSGFLQRHIVGRLSQ